MTRFAMVIDTKTCIGCGDCVVACKTENRVPEGLNRDWVVEATQGKYPQLTTEFRSERCNHCSNATCVTLCPTGASHLWKDSNIVLVAAEMPDIRPEFQDHIDLLIIVQTFIVINFNGLGKF